MLELDFPSLRPKWQPTKLTSSRSFRPRLFLCASSSFPSYFFRSTREVGMEVNSAEQSAPTTPVAGMVISQPIPAVEEPVDASVKSSKQRQRTRRACYPCSKVRVTMNISTQHILTNTSGKSNAIVMNVHLVQTAPNDQILNCAHLTMIDQDLPDQDTLQIPPHLLLAQWTQVMIGPPRILCQEAIHLKDIYIHILRKSIKF